MVNKHTQKCTIPLILCKLQIKTTIICHPRLIKFSKIKNTINSCHIKDIKQLEPSYIIVGNIKSYKHFGKHFDSFFFALNQGPCAC